MKSIAKAIAVASIVGTLAGSAHASEGLFYGGPTGGTDIGQAYLPHDSGFYTAFLLGGLSTDKYYNDRGNRAAVAPVSQVSVALAALEYVYPVKIFGGTVATAAALSYVPYSHVSFSTLEQRNSGVQDMYTDVLAWSRHIGDSGPSALPYGLTVKLAYSMILPIGQYDTSHVINPGHNVFFFIPNASASYLTGPNFLGDGTEFTVSAFYDIASRNRTTNYSSGDVLDFDYAISERIGLWQAGVAGNYATQVTDDRIGNIVANGNGNRFGLSCIGPVIAYTIPKWKAVVKFKWQTSIWSRNAPNQNLFILTFAKAL